MEKNSQTNVHKNKSSSWIPSYTGFVVAGQNCTFIVHHSSPTMAKWVKCKNLLDDDLSWDFTGMETRVGGNSCKKKKKLMKAKLKRKEKKNKKKNSKPPNKMCPV